jgi:hypothetical protein
VSGWVFCIFYKFNIYNSSNLASFSPTIAAQGSTVQTLAPQQ